MSNIFENLDSTKKLEEIYVTKNLDSYKTRIEKLTNKFEKEFKDASDVKYFSVSGRIEVGGNHTDHQLGSVLCASINLDTLGVCKKTNDNIITIDSEGYKKVSVDITDTACREDEKNTTTALIRGMCQKFKDKGFSIGGFNLCLTSDVLTGSGMSSSASFEGMIGVILNNLFCDNKVELVEIAKTGQFAENVYFGKPSGLMDQIGCVLGGFAFINFYDKENPVIEKIDASVLANDYSICIIDTGDSHDDLTDEYANINYEMLEVSKYFNETYLSRVDETKFYENISEIRKVASDRAIMRAMHYFVDSNIVVKQKEALKAGKIDEFLELVKKSGRSSVANLQNIFSCKEPKIQGSSIVLALCEKLLDGKGAFRIHGGGFGGTVEAFVPKDMTENFKTEMEKVVGKDKCYLLSIRNIEATVIN